MSGPNTLDSDDCRDPLSDDLQALIRDASDAGEDHLTEGDGDLSDDDVTE